MDPIRFSLIAVFWVCLALVFYTYIGYLLLVWFLARVFSRQAAPEAVSDQDLPAVSLVIAAYNEETVIEERARNALATDYPVDKLEIVFGLDGCTDHTAAILRRFQDRGIRLLDYPQRRGKATVLNETIAEAAHPIVLLSDANTEIDPRAVRKLVRWFQDPRVGVVCGHVILRDHQSGRNVDSLYWKFETLLKEYEGRLGALLGANGPIYAIRRDLYVPISPETVVDDFVLPLLIKLQFGCAIIYDREAVAHEDTPPDVMSEFHRRARIGAGGFQSIGMLWQLLDPRQGWIAFTFFSHKVLRWLCPFFLIGLLASSASLWVNAFFRWALLAQVAFYGLSLLAAVAPKGVKLPKPVRLMTMFTSMNAALLVGFVRWLGKGQQAAWRRTTRVAEASGALR
jgi:cellulose synthase/poly-beta-1,6-N-acetylglucosamine synthase-like glycosyltransferase